MRKIFLLGITFVLFSANGSYADAPFSAEPAPAQSYQSADTAQPASPSNSVSQDSAQITSVVGTPVSAPTVKPAASPDVSTGAAIISLPTMTNATTAPSSMSQQQIKQQVQNLVASNHVIGTDLTMISANVAQLQQEINQLKLAQAAKAVSPVNHPSFFTMAELHNVKSPLDLSIIAVMVLGLGLLVGQWINRRADRIYVPEKSIFMKRPDILVDDDTKNEFNFMASPEAMPAKLDLARSYMVMNDHEQALGILQTVIENGNEEQRTEAQLLIQKINLKTKNE